MSLGAFMIGEELLEARTAMIEYQGFSWVAFVMGIELVHPHLRWCAVEGAWFSGVRTFPTCEYQEENLKQRDGAGGHRRTSCVVMGVR